MKTVYFIRHGEAEGNAGEYFQDHETPLTEKGHTAARAVAERLSHLAVEALVVSPMVRAQETAAHIERTLTVPMETIESFHERLYPKAIRGVARGSSEGKEFLKKYHQYYRDPNISLEGFENFYAVMKRVEQSVHFLELHPKNVIAVVSHRGFITSVVSYLLLQKQADLEYNLAIDASLVKLSNTGIAEFQYDDATWRLAKWNDVAHFAE